MSARNRIGDVDPASTLGKFLADLRMRIERIERGALRGPNQSFAMPFRVGDWIFDQNSDGDLTVTHAESGVTTKLADR